MALYAWNGSSWVLAPQKKAWNGSSWLEAKGAKVWNGSAWKEFLNCSITTGNDGFVYGGGKGTEGYLISEHGYDGGDSYGPYGSYDGSIIGLAPYSCYWQSTLYDVSQPDYKFNVRLPGNVAGSKSILFDGSVITNAVSGTYDGGSNSTTFLWFNDNGDTVPTTNPFGADNEIHNVQLV